MADPTYVPAPAAPCRAPNLTPPWRRLLEALASGGDEWRTVQKVAASAGSTVGVTRPRLLTLAGCGWCERRWRIEAAPVLEYRIADAGRTVIGGG